MVKSYKHLCTDTKMAYKHALPAKQIEELIIDILNTDLTAGYKNVYKTL